MRKMKYMSEAERKYIKYLESCMIYLHENEIWEPLKKKDTKTYKKGVLSERLSELEKELEELSESYIRHV